MFFKDVCLYLNSNTFYVTIHHSFNMQIMCHLARPKDLNKTFRVNLFVENRGLQKKDGNTIS